MDPSALLEASSKGANTGYLPTIASYASREPLVPVRDARHRGLWAPGPDRRGRGHTHPGHDAPPAGSVGHRPRKTGADRALRATGPLPVGLRSRAVGGPAAETGDGRVAAVRDVTHRQDACGAQPADEIAGPGQRSQGLWARRAAADSTARRAALGWRPSSSKCRTPALSSNRHRRRLDIRTNLGSNRWTNAGRVR